MSSTGSKNSLLAVSKAEAPNTLTTSDWYLYSFPHIYDNGDPNTVSVDGTQIGVGCGAVVLSSQLYNGDGSPRAAPIRIFDKQRLLQGSKATPTDLYARHPDGGPVPFVIPAVHFECTDTFFLMSSGPFNGGTSCESVLGIRNVLGSPALVGLSLPDDQSCDTRTDRRPPLMPQLGGGLPLNAGGGLRPPVVFRNRALWTARAQALNVGSNTISAIRWIQVDVGKWPASIGRAQQGIISEADTWISHPSLMVDGSNNVAVVFARSSPREYASTWYSARLGTDPPNTMRAPIILKSGTANLLLNSDGPFGILSGSYFGIAADPGDGSFWMLGEYAKTGHQWGTWVGNLKVVAPLFSSISPSTLSQGQRAQVTIAGQNLAGAQLAVPPDADIVISNVVSNSTSIAATLDVGTGAQTGDRNLTISTMTGSTTAILTITADPTLAVITSIVNGASFVPVPLAQNTWFSVLGKNFGSLESAPNGTATNLGGTSITACGILVPLNYNTGQGQINALMPAAVAGKTSCPIVAIVNGRASVAFSISIAAESLGVFLFSRAGSVLPVATHADYSVIGPSSVGLSPATSGETITLWCTGWNEGAANPTITVNGAPAAVLYYGPSGSSPGLCQINVNVPLGSDAGSNDLNIGPLPPYSLWLR